MTKKEKFIDYLLHKPRFLLSLVWARFAPVMPDVFFDKVMFWLRAEYWPDLKNPRSFNEKLNWLKFNDIHPEYTKMVDKLTAKDYVASLVGEQYIIPTIGVWNSVDEIEWDSLPKQFVVKATCDSGGVVVCRDKSKLDVEAAKNKLKSLGGQDYNQVSKEYPYKNVPHRFIAEQYMSDKGAGIDGELKDYKFFCFNGEVKMFKIDFDRFKDHHANYYDIKGNILPFGEKICPPLYNRKLEIPSNISEMIKLAEILSKEIPFLRVDFYNVAGKIYFGELTFFPASGMGPFIPKEWDNKLGTWLKLPIE